MKVLIWVLCIFANSLLVTILEVCGVSLGAIPTVILYGVTVWVARTLCEKWDEHKVSKKTEITDIPQDAESSITDITEQICFCRKCGEKLIDNSKFCRKCGTKVIEE